MVEDIRTVDPFGSGGGNEGLGLISLGHGRALFRSGNFSLGFSLFGTQGTFATTELLFDSQPASGAAPSVLGVASGIAFVAVTTPVVGTFAIWRTDGTQIGTWPLLGPDAPGGLVASIDPHGGDAARFVVTENHLYFVGCREGIGCDLWSTRGLAEPVQLAVDLPTGSPPEVVSSLVAAGSRVWWLQGDAVSLYDEELDAAQIVSLPPGLGASALTPSGELAFFLALFPEDELWVSDGTASGTHPVSSFSAPEVFGPFPWLEATERGVVFVVDDVLHGFELWDSDGTEEGTRRVTEFGFAGALANASPSRVVAAGDRYLFEATDGVGTTGLWSAEDAAGPMTFLGAVTGPVDAMQGIGDLAMFRSGSGVWTSDGTLGGTMLLLACEVPCLVPEAPTGVLAELLFARGSTLWRSDGFAAGTTPVLALPSNVTAGSEAARSGGAIYVAGNDELHGLELWSGPAGGSGLLVADALREAPSANPQSLLAVGERVTFAACTGEQTELMLGDGEARVAASLPDLAPFSFHCASQDIEVQWVVSGDQVFLLHHDTPSGAGSAAYAIDVTTNHVVELLEVSPPASLEGLVALGGEAFFFVRLAGSLSLWKSAGDPPTTEQLLALPGELSTVNDAAGAGATLYFVAGTNGGGEELWAVDTQTKQATRLWIFAAGDRQFGQPIAIAGLRAHVPVLAGEGVGIVRSDGTMAGTELLSWSHQEPRFYATQPRDLVDHQGALVFSLVSWHPETNSDGRVEVWSLGHSDSGTMIETFPYSRPDPYNFLGVELASDGASVWFAADDGVHGTELWTSPGSPGAARLVRDLRPGASSSSPEDIVGDGGRVWFSAEDSTRGRELFTSDGSEGGTILVHDLATGGLSSEPRQLTLGDRFLYFSADDGIYGRELWALPLSEGSCSSGEHALCVTGNRFRVEVAWRDFRGNSGRGLAEALTADTGYFWFFDPANVEIVVKVLDARVINDRFWVFAGALSNVEYFVTVTDDDTGATARYFNPEGTFASFGDVEALGGPATSVVSSLRDERHLRGATARTIAAACAPNGERLCLSENRFSVEVSWSDGQGGSGRGQARTLTSDTGHFWFFDEANVELVLKVLDARALNGKFWVFYGALSNVEYTITVTDTATGVVKTYSNPAGQFASSGDTEAF